MTGKTAAGRAGIGAPRRQGACPTVSRGSLTDWPFALDTFGRSCSGNLVPGTLVSIAIAPL